MEHLADFIGARPHDERRFADCQNLGALGRGDGSIEQSDMLRGGRVGRELVNDAAVQFDAVTG